MGTRVPRFRFSFRKASSAAIATLTVGLLPWSLSAAADNDNNNNNNTTDQSGDSSGTKHDNELKEVVVTGSLIPQSAVSITTPTAVITNEDIQARGFADIAEAIQRTSFATGSIQGGQFSGGFTQGIKTVSFFGLDPSFAKYLIDGRPVADYPALYNGSENTFNLGGVPEVLVDHIDILPGAHSSIYGSDAISAVINVSLKKNLDGPVADARYGWTADGGGNDKRFAIGDGVSIGNFNAVIGGQYEKVTPIWGYQRPLTSQYYTQGSTPQTAERDYLILGLFGQPNGNLYYFEDPANCANTAPGFDGSEKLYTRTDRGNYCGTTRSGFYTLQNGDESTQGYLHASYDVTDHVQVFFDTLVNHDVVKFNVGQLFYGSDVDSTSPFYYYEDPNLDAINIANGGGPDYYNLQHIFSPEEAGGRDKNDDKNTNNSIRATLGVQGDFFQSWKYVADFTYTQNKLTETTSLLFAQPLEGFFSSIFGPQLGVGPLGDFQYTPNYAQFYKPVTPAQYNTFFNQINSYSQTEESFARAQVTTTDLFPLPGGNAGAALQLEGGDQGWFYNPDADYLNGTTFGYTATAGSGHRSRYAGTTELQLPVLSQVTANLSGRYDDYRVAGSNVNKFTYNLSLEYKPVDQFKLHGNYGTAFKAPTLADEFQGASGFFEGVTDYYTCAKAGFTGTNIGNCPQFGESVFGVQSGNTKLQPITAKTWDLGFIVAPINKMTLTADYLHWSIVNEINDQSADKLSQTDAACLLGSLDINSPTCQAAIAQVQRAGPANAQGFNTGQIIQVLTPKQNVAQENLGAIQLGLDYKFYAGAIGEFDVTGQYTDLMSHNFQQFAGDPIINLLDSPFYSEEFKTKANTSLTWTRNPVSATLYVERYGKTPNYIATNNITQYATPGAGDVGAWTLANASVSYQPLHDVDVTFAVNNLFNTGPPADHSTPGIINQPYNVLNYNVYGRVYYITVSYHASK
jgi:iron complex outermembrane receptor protein